ncbi:MAG: hypothetical protein WC906_00535 [Parcubacteria group bacterium]|jgi:hypothetical protein
MSTRAFLSKKIISIVLFLGISLAPHFCHAFWPADWALNAQMTVMLETMQQQILGATMGALKQAAIQTVNQTVNNAMSQITGEKGPRFIVNWDDFIISEPLDKAELYMNDFFSSVIRGRGSSSNYSGFGSELAMGNNFTGSKVAGASILKEGVVAGNFTSDSLRGNYLGSLEEEAKNLTVNATIPVCDITNASGMFSGKDWKVFSGVIGKDTCNKFGFNNISTSIYLSQISSQQEIAKTKSVAYQGFNATTSGGLVITPGSTIAAIQAQVEDLPNKVLAAAKSAPEIITSLVTRLATKTIQQGIGQAQQYVQKEINNNVNNYSQQIKNLNPGEKYQSKY